MVNRKGIGYTIEAFIAAITLFVFVLGSFSSPPPQSWDTFQDQIAAKDMSHTLKKTGHLEQFLGNGETGSIQTVAETLSKGRIEVSGNVENLPIQESSIGFHVLPGDVYTESLVDVTAGDSCEGDLEELESEYTIKRTEDTGGSRESYHGIRIYVTDSDPKESAGFNGNIDYDTFWVDNGTDCQFGASEGPFFLDEFFLWGNTTDTEPDNHYDMKAIDPAGGSFTVYPADQPASFRNTLQKPVNGIKSDTEVDTFTFTGTDLSSYDVLVFREDAPAPDDTLSEIDANLGRVNEYLQNGNSILLLANLQEPDLTNFNFLDQTGFRWIDLPVLTSTSSNPSTTCPTTGSVTITSGTSCTYSPGKYLLTSLTVESGATVNINNTPKACDTSFRGSGCLNEDYEDYSPLLLVDGPVDIQGTIQSSQQGFNSSAWEDHGPGAGGSDAVSGGGGYGGEGGDSDAHNDGGPSYGAASDADRLGSAGGYDTDAPGRGGTGGGSVWIKANGELTLDGSILANGGDGNAGGAGGGAGGSVRLQADQFSGGGEIRAQGGDNSNRGGGGGGGRVALIRRTGTTNPYYVNVSGGFKGNSGEDGDPGSIHTAQNNFDVGLYEVGFSDSEDSRDVEDYFKGLSGDPTGVMLPLGGKIASMNENTLVPRNQMAFAKTRNYDTDDWNATRSNMPSSGDPPGGPTNHGSCSDTSEDFDFVTDTGTESLKVWNQELGTTAANCKGIFGLSIDRDDDGDVDWDNESTYLNNDEIVINNRRYQVRIYSSDSAEFVYQGKNPELIHYRTSFDGMDIGRFASAGFEATYNVDERRLLAGTMYWLIGDRKSFGENRDSEVSTTTVGSVKNNVYMPYVMNLRWRR